MNACQDDLSANILIDFWATYLHYLFINGIRFSFEQPVIFLQTAIIGNGTRIVEKSPKELAMKKLSYLAILFIFSLFTSCTTYQNQLSNTNILTVDDLPCENRSDGVYLFFDQEEIDFDYTKIGFVHVNETIIQGDDYSLDFLKYKAWANCANAILFIKSDYKIWSLDEDVYSDRIYGGVAVKINIDQAFIAKYGTNNNLSFVQRVESADTKLDESRKIKGLGWMILIVVAISGLLSLEI